MSRDIELEKQIDAYVKGKLSEEEAQELWEKLLQHPDYIELLKTELGVKSILEKRSSNNNSTSAEESSIIYSIQNSWKWMAAAAAVALLVVSINFFQLDTNKSLQSEVPGQFNLAENLSSAEVFRSQKTATLPADSLLNRGFEAALSGDISKAIAAYDKIINKYGDESAATKAYLNKGIIQYNSGKFGESIESFKAVIKRDTKRDVLEEKAYWYMGNAFINIEQLEKAREAIHKVYSMDGIYRKPSFRLLKKLDYKLGNVDFDNFEEQIKEGK
ncbi:tetratricopeptide repeat protein [Fodinibius sp.]|uniref:tetratricopeptide repeat protein n=1 Tax=Fodinibius sp. TaxID=1872440 RepID=UPI002ACDDBA1|nr:tetratricopeptide repeat protein [Fodinibius sp.]MDZ7659085.1 tetratricopeptide repeat protein [Fodinibius sp.]